MATCCCSYTVVTILSLLSHNFSRVHSLLEGGGNVVLGGESDRDDLYIPPTIITDVELDDPMMQDEVSECHVPYNK